MTWRSMPSMVRRPILSPLASTTSRAEICSSFDNVISCRSLPLEMPDTLAMMVSTAGGISARMVFTSVLPFAALALTDAHAARAEIVHVVADDLVGGLEDRVGHVRLRERWTCMRERYLLDCADAFRKGDHDEFGRSPPRVAANSHRGEEADAGTGVPRARCRDPRF